MCHYLCQSLGPEGRQNGDALGLWGSSSGLAPLERHLSGRVRRIATRGLYKRHNYEQIVKVVSSPISRRPSPRRPDSRNPPARQGFRAPCTCTRKRLARICRLGVYGNTLRQINAACDRNHEKAKDHELPAARPLRQARQGGEQWSLSSGSSRRSEWQGADPCSKIHFRLDTPGKAC